LQQNSRRSTHICFIFSTEYYKRFSYGNHRPSIFCENSKFCNSIRKCNASQVKERLATIIKRKIYGICNGNLVKFLINFSLGKNIRSLPESPALIEFCKNINFSNLNFLFINTRPKSNL